MPIEPTVAMASAAVGYTYDDTLPPCSNESCVPSEKSANARMPTDTEMSGPARRLTSGTMSPRATMSTMFQRSGRLRSGKPPRAVEIALAWISGPDMTEPVGVAWMS